MLSGEPGSERRRPREPPTRPRLQMAGSIPRIEGDEGSREKSTETMKRLLARSGTIVFASHNLNSVGPFYDRAMWMERGRSVLVGKSLDVVAAYREVSAKRSV